MAKKKKKIQLFLKLLDIAWSLWRIFLCNLFHCLLKSIPRNNDSWGCFTNNEKVPQFPMIRLPWRTSKTHLPNEESRTFQEKHSRRSYSPPSSTPSFICTMEAAPLYPEPPDYLLQALQQHFLHPCSLTLQMRFYYGDRVPCFFLFCWTDTVMRELYCHNSGNSAIKMLAINSWKVNAIQYYTWKGFNTFTKTLVVFKKPP